MICWIFILAITFSVVQISDGVFGSKKRSWDVPTMAPDPFKSPSWPYSRKQIGNSEEYDELTTTPYPFINDGPRNRPSRFPRVGLSCFGCCGSSSSENDVEYGGGKHKHKKKKKPKKTPKGKKDKKHKKHHGNKNDGDLWAPRRPVDYELPNVNEVFD